LRGKEQEQLSLFAKTAFRALHMSGFARMDFRLSADGRIYLLEANANPNLSNGEDLADAAKAAGLCYTALVERIVQLGLGYRPEWRQFEP
jgi:D-alanine-D-alanine ligase